MYWRLFINWVLASSVCCWYFIITIIIYFRDWALIMSVPASQVSCARLAFGRPASILPLTVAYTVKPFFFYNVMFKWLSIFLRSCYSFTYWKYTHFLPDIIIFLLSVKVYPMTEEKINLCSLDTLVIIFC